MKGPWLRPALWTAGLLLLPCLPACRSPATDSPVALAAVRLQDPGSAPADPSAFDEATPPRLPEPPPDDKPALPWARRGCKDWLADCWRETCDTFKEEAHLVWQDHKNYYSSGNLALLALGLGIAAPLANTPADRQFQDWYQNKVRSADTDEFSRYAKMPGHYPYMLPIILGATVGGKLTDDTLPGAITFDWGSRCCRALLVGAPTVGILQVSLGAGRPSEDPSQWWPFNDKNGVSGHGFVAAVPFLTAARMTDNRLARFSLVAVSTIPTWSRLNDDDHYLSQAWLGWWIAYLSVRSVDRTERDRRIEFVPACEGTTGLGFSVLFRY
jgi:hypothetical protein